MSLLTMTLGPRRHRQTMAFDGAMAQAQRPIRSTVCAIFRIGLMSGWVWSPAYSTEGWSLVGESDLREDIGS